MLDNVNFGNEFLTEKQAAAYLKFSAKALQKWRCLGGGPKFIKVSAKAVRYRLADLLDWADKRVVSSTSEKKEA